MSYLHGTLFSLLLAFAGTPVETRAEPVSPHAADSLTLPRALALARNHPAVVALDREVMAREALAARAGRPANPRLSVEAENFAGTGDLTGTRALETTLQLEQSVELGGKRALRKRQAGAEARLAENERLSGRWELERSVRQAFAEALWHQEKAALADRKMRMLESTGEKVRHRHEAGGASTADALKMRVERSLARLESERVRRDAETARMRLAFLLGDSLTEFAGVKGDFHQVEPLPDWDAVHANISRHPDLLRWNTERELRTIARQAARAENVPDLDFHAGVRRQSRQEGPGGHDLAWVGGVSLPLPLWNRNAGNIAGASHRLSGLEQEEEAARREMQTRAHALWNGLRTRSGELERYRNEILPDAEAAAAAARAAYAAGRQSALDLLDGQRLLFELNDRYLETLAAWHHDFAELETLSGPFNAFDEENTP